METKHKLVVPLTLSNYEIFLHIRRVTACDMVKTMREVKYCNHCRHWWGKSKSLLMEKWGRRRNVISSGGIPSTVPYG